MQHRPTVTITYFVPDDKKAGGSYVDITESVKRIDLVRRQIVLMSTEGKGQLNKTIDFDKIINISGDLVDYLDDTLL